MYKKRTFLAYWKQYKRMGILLLLAIILKVWCFFPHLIDTIYLPYIFSTITTILRVLFGWLPFSIGDLVYVLLGISLLYTIISIIKKGISKQLVWRTFFVKMISAALLLYCIFQLCWGLAYHRKGIANQLGVDTSKQVDSTQVLQLLLESIDSINAVAPLVKDSTSFLLKNIQKDLYVAYNNAAKHYPFLQYNMGSVKHSLVGKLLSNMGFMGYYNPFSGEAQINKGIPSFMQPNVALHEMAHQLGYAKEDEANMVGYVVAMHSTNAYVKYSFYFDLINYTKMELIRLDSTTRKAILQQLHPQVKKDFAAWQNYLSKKQSGLMYNISQSFYNNYLKINSSSKGLMSYNDVVKLMVLYTNKLRSR